MKLSEIYLRQLQESKTITHNSNAPCAAYEAVYEKKCPQLWGRFPGAHGEKNWNGIIVDEHLKDEWLNDLSKIKGLEIRSSCEGHNKDWLTFVIFRFRDGRSRNTEELETNIESSDSITKCSAHIGAGGKLRVVVTAKIWYGQPQWEKWWSTLAKRISENVK